MSKSRAEYDEIESKEAKIYNETVVGVVNQLNIIEMLAFLNYTPEEITRQTYLYVDDDGALCGVEKHDPTSRMMDEFYPVGYVRAFGYLNETKAMLREFLS